MALVVVEQAKKASGRGELLKHIADVRDALADAGPLWERITEHADDNHMGDSVAYYMLGAAWRRIQEHLGNTTRDTERTWKCVWKLEYKKQVCTHQI